MPAPGKDDYLLMHGWVCGKRNAPCGGTGLVTDRERRRVLYAARLSWGADGSTPRLAGWIELGAKDPGPATSTPTRTSTRKPEPTTPAGPAGPIDDSDAAPDPPASEFPESTGGLASTGALGPLR